MNFGYSDINYLDRLRHTSGVDSCKDFFCKLVKKRRNNAVQMINDRRLNFPSLFVLRPEIHEFSLEEELSERNKTALKLCEVMADEKKDLENSNHVIPMNSEHVHRVLLWMLYTGAVDDGLSDEFDQIMDITASVLIKTHHEESVLPTIAGLIFHRNRVGSYNHDLIWAFFQTRNINSLKYIAGYLRSSDKNDVQLARELLNLPEETSLDGSQEYGKYLSWLRENEPYLYFTGEGLQFSNRPELLCVDEKAKYLCKKIDARTHKPIAPYSEQEIRCLKSFDEAAEDEKSTLADYSQALYRRNHRYWNQWIHYPIEKQISIAKYGRRELV
jgi:hypothetical protein